MPKNPKLTPQGRDLMEAVAQLQSGDEVRAFSRDLLTPSEIAEFTKRFHIAKLLWTTTKTYPEIAKEADTSTTTVARVAQWLYRERWQGYATVLTRQYGPSKR